MKEKNSIIKIGGIASITSGILTLIQNLFSNGRFSLGDWKCFVLYYTTVFLNMVYYSWNKNIVRSKAGKQLIIYFLKK